MCSFEWQYISKMENILIESILIILTNTIDMQNFDVLHVNSLKNDGSFSSTQGTYNQERATYNFGTLSGNHNITIMPEWLHNAPHLHIYGHLNGFDLIIHLGEGSPGEYPEAWDYSVLEGHELFITFHADQLSASDVYLYWNAVITGPKLLDETNKATYKNHGVFVNWFDGTADATHIYSEP